MQFEQKILMPYSMEATAGYTDSMIGEGTEYTIVFTALLCSYLQKQF
jgi:hypothetical protein